MEFLQVPHIKTILNLFVPLKTCCRLHDFCTSCRTSIACLHRRPSKNDLSSIGEEIFSPGFFIILFFATCLSSADAGLLNFLSGIDPSTQRRKLNAEIYLAILVVYYDLTLLLYYVSPFTVLTNQKFRYIIFHQIDQ